MLLLAAAAAVTGCGGHRDRATDEGATTTVRVFAGTGQLYPKHLHRPPTENN